jgi:hypothetical protein
VLRLVARATTIAMEMPITIAMLKGLCLSQVVQSGELGPCKTMIVIEMGPRLEASIPTEELCSVHFILMNN